MTGMTSTMLPSYVGEPLQVPFRTHPCRCVKTHTPKINHTVIHHIVPMYWGGADTPENEIAICPNTHSEIHRMQDVFRRASKVVAMSGVSRYAYDLAVRGWKGKMVS